MKNKVIWFTLSLLLVTATLLASCATSTQTSTSTSTQTSTSTSTQTSTSTSTQTSASTSTPMTTSTTVAGNWWDSLGTPQYGGTMVLRVNQNITNFDPINSESFFTIESAWMERLFANDWTLDPSVFDYKIQFRSDQYAKGGLAKSWEFTDPNTFVLHLYQGIHWQDISPANGREFTADDVVFHYDRALGLGDGFTTPAPYWGGVTQFQQLSSVTATDKYTVAFKWKVANPEFIMETQEPISTSGQSMENSDAVNTWGNLNDWHHAIGTGPFILQDFVSGSSATLIKNPNYWGHDERYPQNKLPYIDTLKILIISDTATALGALRTGKIDVMDNISFANAQLVQKTNPEILQIPIPGVTAVTIDPRNDVKPFNDIKVREAMQMALDLPNIAKNYYGGTASPYPSTMTSNYVTGWGFPYSEWPQDLKDQYAYNPTQAKALLAAAGYPNGFNTDIVADVACDLQLLQVVQSDFADIGINMEIRTMDSVSWTNFVLTNRKLDQLGMRSVGSLGMTHEPTRQLTRFVTGNSPNYMMVNDPVYNAFNTSVMAATTLDGMKQVVKNANEYVAEQHFCISVLQPTFFGLCQPWLKGYNGQFGGVTAGNDGGISFLFFYPARFWIDKSQK